MNIFKRALKGIRDFFAKKSPLLVIGVNIGAGMLVSIVPLPDTLKPVATMAVRGLLATIFSTTAMWLCYGTEPGIHVLQDATFYTAVAAIGTVFTVPMLVGSIVIGLWKMRFYLASIFTMFRAKVSVNTNFQTDRVTIEGEYNEVA